MKLVPLSAKQLDFIDGSTARINIAEGAVRSAKTFSTNIRWLEYVREGPPGDLFMVGKTRASLRRNVLNDLFDLLGAKRFHWTNKQEGELNLCGRRVYVVGANDERAEEKIRGATIAGAYCDEASLYPESFWMQLQARASIAGAQIFANTNPDSPFHWLYKGFIDNDELKALGIVKTWHFTLDDNPALTKEYKDSLKAIYSGIWYDRMILGLWVMAEGRVYDMFEESKHVVAKLPAMRRYWATADYGTSNAAVILLLGEGTDDRLYVCREYRWDSHEKGRRLTDAQLSADYRRWIGTTLPLRVFIDPSAASFIQQLYYDGVKGIRHADNAVVDGIQEVSTLLGEDRLRIHASCEGLIQEMGLYVWDAKAQERGEDAPLKKNDHGPDALRYGVRGLRNVWRRWVANVKEAA